MVYFNFAIYSIVYLEMIQSGRLGQLIYVSQPDITDRKEFFLNSKLINNWSNDIDIDKLSNDTVGLSIAQLSQISKDASFEAMKRGMEKNESTQITLQDFKI